MRVLIVYGSKMGGTAGIADMIGDAFTRQGAHADVVRAEDARAPESYDAVIVGSALYAFRWRRAAAGFVRQYSETLRAKPTWFFSSGPLDDSASAADLPPTRQVDRLMARAEARGHKTFGGRLKPDAEGFPARAMAKTHAGDWRRPDEIEAWVAGIAAELGLTQNAVNVPQPVGAGR